MKTKVSIVKCKDYERPRVEESVKKAFDLLGGIEAFIKKGDRVLVKPNMLSARPPEDAVCTHLEVIRAVVRLVKSCSAAPFIGDNPGGSISPLKAYEGSGLVGLAKQEGVELKESKEVKLIKDMPISSYFFECDKIINLPKMKTHSLMRMTGAVKNMYGAVAGLHKSSLHKRFPAPEDFAAAVVDVFEAVRPALTLMDGIVSMDQAGPSSGRKRGTGILIAGSDSVAVDAVFAGITGKRPLEIPAIKEAYKRKLGEADLNNIEILGETLKGCALKDFDVPGRFRFSAVLGLLADFVKFGPWINERICRKCMICRDTCPVSAITIDSKKQVIDPKACIRCMCCHEVCPHKAIEFKRNFLARIFGL